MIINRDWKKEELQTYTLDIKTKANVLKIFNLVCCCTYIVLATIYAEDLKSLAVIALVFYTPFLLSIFISSMNSIANKYELMLLKIDLDDQKEIARYYENQYEMMVSDSEES